jgi:hypothetical protein
LKVVDVKSKLRKVLAWFDVIHVDRELATVLSPTFKTYQPVPLGSFSAKLPPRL